MISFLCVCSGNDNDKINGNQQEDKMQSSPLEIIQDNSTDIAQLIVAIEKLGTASVSADFWNDIANDTRYHMPHRKHCVLQLIKRNAKAGMQLVDFLNLFRGQSWWTDSKWEIVDALFGKLPIHFDIDLTILKLDVLPEEDTNICHIYFSVKPRINSDEFKSWVNGNSSELKDANYEIIEIGYAGNFLRKHNVPY